MSMIMVFIFISEEWALIGIWAFIRINMVYTVYIHTYIITILLAC